MIQISKNIPFSTLTKTQNLRKCNVSKKSTRDPPYPLNARAGCVLTFTKTPENLKITREILSYIDLKFQTLVQKIKITTFNALVPDLHTNLFLNTDLKQHKNIVVTLTPLVVSTFTYSRSRGFRTPNCIK